MQKTWRKTTCLVCGVSFSDSENRSTEGIDLCPECFVQLFDSSGEHRAKIRKPPSN
jgi:Zn-finger nucleic acid-binding protein